MTKQHENGKLQRVHIWVNRSDWLLVKHLARKAKANGSLAASELLRELLSHSLRGLRPGQIVAYDALLKQQLEFAQRHLAAAMRRINVPKQGPTVILRRTKRA